MDSTSNYKIIDLSVSIDSKLYEPNPIEVKKVDHKKGADILGETLIHMKGKNVFLKFVEKVKHIVGLGLDYKSFPDEKGLSLYTYKLTTHTGTHLDAPFHFGDKNSSGQKAKTITEIPLEWCFGHGVLLDLEKNDEINPVSKNEIILKLKKIGYEIRPFDIVLIKTGGDKNIGKSEYFSNFRGISAEATEFLIDCGVKIIGVDSFGFDPPFAKMIQAYISNKDKKYLWPSHFLGREKEYVHIERLTNLGDIKNPTGFKVCCFPIKLLDSDAAWSRVVALENY